MTTTPVDSRFALDAANSSDLVQKKLSIDAMRKRVSGGPGEEKKLRDACEGFESIFLQRMWEQMRKNVKKEGYLHSKDEEAYQSMFDTELAKKMASAGGIGLADMLYQQLSQKLTNTSRTTHAMAAPLPIEPARAPKPQPAAPQPAVPAPQPEELYSEVAEEPDIKKEQADQAILEQALAELEAAYDPSLDPANATYPMFDLQNGAPMNPVAERVKEETGDARREYAVNPLPERVSAPGRERPSRSAKSIGRGARHTRRAMKTAEPEQQTPAAGNPAMAAPVGAPQAGRVAPANSGDASAAAGRWPVEGQLVSGYGRQTGPDGASSWNTGMEFAVTPGMPVTAPLDGVVAFAGERDGVGIVVLEHADGLSSYFTNTDATLRQGDAVKAGMEFALIASSDGTPGAGTADSTGRMRFELRRGELALNPEKLLA